MKLLPILKLVALKSIFSKINPFYHWLWKISRKTHIRFAEIKPNNPKKGLTCYPHRKIRSTK